MQSARRLLSRRAPCQPYQAVNATPTGAIMDAFKASSIVLQLCAFIICVYADFHASFTHYHADLWHERASAHLSLKMKALMPSMNALTS